MVIARNKCHDSYELQSNLSMVGPELYRSGQNCIMKGLFGLENRQYRVQYLGHVGGPGRPKGSKYSTRRYLPKTRIMIPKMETLNTL